MPDVPYSVSIRGAWCRGLVFAIVLFAGRANAYDVDNTLDPSAWPDGFSGGDYYSYPGYGALGYLDPGYAFSLATGYANPAYDAGGYGSQGFGGSGYGYPAYGRPGYGPDDRGNYAPSYGESDTVPAVNRQYIRQLEERVRKLEKANEQTLPPYSERYTPSVFSTPNPGNQPAYTAPGAGYAGQPGRQGSGSQASSNDEYPTYQPRYGGPPTYQFRQ
jgi:hypothetical protein